MATDGYTMCHAEFVGWESENPVLVNQTCPVRYANGQWFRIAHRSFFWNFLKVEFIVYMCARADACCCYNESLCVLRSRHETNIIKQMKFISQHFPLHLLEFAVERCSVGDAHLKCTGKICHRCFNWKRLFVARLESLMLLVYSRWTMFPTLFSDTPSLQSCGRGSQEKWDHLPLFTYQS